MNWTELRDWTKPRSFVTGVSCGLFAMPLGAELFRYFNSQPLYLYSDPAMEAQRRLWGRNVAIGCYVLAASQLALYHRNTKHSKEAFAVGALASAVYPAFGSWFEPHVPGTFMAMLKHGVGLYFRQTLFIYRLTLQVKNAKSRKHPGLG